MAHRSENLEVILFGWIDALRRNDPDVIAPQLAEGIVWQGLRPDLVCPNRGAVLENIRTGGRHRRRVSGLEVAAITDEHVLLDVRLPGVTELYGEPVAGGIFTVFTVRGGLIVRIDEFTTREDALDSVNAVSAPGEPGRAPREPGRQDAAPPATEAAAVRQATVERVVPILNVSDVRESFDWFEKLGWRRGFEWNPDGSAAGPGFGSVVSDRSEIFLCRDGQGSRGRGSNAQTFGPEGTETGDKGGWMTVWVDDLDALYARCVTERLEITHPPTEEPWGVREFHVRHPDGHVFRISRAG